MQTLLFTRDVKLTKMLVSVFTVLLLLFKLPICDCQATQSEKYSTTQAPTFDQLLPLIWSQLGTPNPLNQIHIAYCSSSPFYVVGAQTILDSYNLASQAASPQQQALDVQVKAYFISNNFTFATAGKLLVDLFFFQVDIVVSDGNWLAGLLAETLGVPNLLLYSSFPNPTFTNYLFSYFFLGFYYGLKFSPLDVFYVLSNQIQSSSQNGSSSGSSSYNSYNYYYEDYFFYYYSSPATYQLYASNTNSFARPLISVNPYAQQNSPIYLNVTFILDANLPYNNNMANFQALCTSVISTMPNTAMFILTIPAEANQAVFDTIVANLMNTPGPRIVYATKDVAAQLIASINRVGSFTTSFTNPVYQWHFVNFTGGYASDPLYTSTTSAPYIFHWELYNLQAFQAQCPNAACPSCGSALDRLLDCDFGLYLNDIVSQYADLLNQTCAGSFSNCTAFNKQQYLSNLLGIPINNSAYASGPILFDTNGNRIGGYANVYVGLNPKNAQMRVSCTFVSAWSCTLFPYNAPTQTATSVLFVVYNTPPFYYLNGTTGLYDGFYVALAQLIASQAGIKNYTIMGSSKIGSYDPVSGNWTGLIGAVLGPADIALAPLVAIQNLSQSLSFSNPYLQVQLSALQQVPDPTTTVGDLFYLIFRPFSAYNWILQAGSIVAVALLMTTIDYFSPNLVPFGLRRSWFYVFARSVMGAGGQNPDVFSSRILMLFWSFVTMITISTYTANLSALTIDNKQSSQYISSFTDLLNSQWTPCCVVNSFTSTYFMSSTVPFEMAVWNVMSKCQFASQAQAMSVLSNWSNPAAANMVLVLMQPAASYSAYIYENLAITANYTLINLLVAVPAGLQAPVPVYTINKAIQNLTTTGQLTQIKDTYLRLPKTGFPPDGFAQLSSFLVETSGTVFTIKNMFGIFLIMFGGALFTLSVSGIERYVVTSWKAYTERKRRENAEFIQMELSCSVSAENRSESKKNGTEKLTSLSAVSLIK